MRKICNRTLALLLALMLCISIVPVSAFATETEQTDDSTGVTEELRPADVPVVYARDPLSTVKSDLEGGSNYLTNYGVTREAIVQELESHKNDNYYLGTPYAGGDYQSPNGDPSYNGSPLLNCTGFVSYVLRKVGLNASKVMSIMESAGANYWYSGRPYDIMAGASNYYTFAKQAGLTCYVYNTKAEMLADGKCEKGDIILMYWSQTPFNDGADNHIGFFWGESSGDDVLWHSSTHPESGNQIGPITPKTEGSIYILIKIEPMGYNVTLTKTSADASYTQDNNSYSLAGATYAVYTTSNATGTPVATFITDANGHAELEKPLGNGTYTVKETKAPKGYKLDKRIYTFHINGSDTSLDVQDDPGRAAFRLVKRDPQTGQIGQGNGTLAGAVYRITYQKGDETVTQEGTSNAQGVIEPVFTDIPFGTVTVQEIKAPEGYKLDTRVHTYQIDSPDLVGDVFEMEPDDLTEEVIRGGLSVEKRDTVTGSTPQGDAGFGGITFQIINKSKNPVIVNGNSYAPDEVVLELVTDAEGKASTANDALPYGEYLLHESATNGSMLNTAPDQQVIISEDHKMYNFVMENEVVRGGVLIEKRDLESKLLTPLGGASLDGTQFEITNRSKNAVCVNGALYEPGAVCLTIEVKGGIAQSDARALPFGTYSMVESKLGTGYLWTDKKVRDFAVSYDGEVTKYREGNAAYNQVKRGDLRFVKVGEDNMHRFGNVAFKLTSQTTGESHILITDENGEVRTEAAWNAHTLNTNGNDDADESTWDDLTGTWFGLTTEGWMVETQDSLCALPYDHYVLEELRCPGNEGYDLVTVPNIFISRDSTVIELGTIDDKVEVVPEIGTTATVDGEKMSDPLPQVTLVDTVAYSGLTAGKTYTLSGILMDKGTGKPLEIDGKQVTAEKQFTPKFDHGVVELEYTFDASTLAGRAVVVFETLYQDGIEVASHADINDEGQTVGFKNPKIGTTAAVNGEKTADPLGEVTIIDTVTYIGLTAGKEYTVKGVLMDKGTGEKLLVNGKEVTAEATFIAPKSEGSINIPFTFDASGLAGKSVVVFESLYRKGFELVVHADIEDEKQTVFVSRKGELIIKKTAEDNMVEGISFLVTGHNYAETFITDEQGEIYIKDLALGEYKVTELLNERTARYVIEEGKVVTVTAGDDAATVEFHNELRRGQIVGRKTDAAKNPLAGVVFGLFPADATDFAEKDAIATAQTSYDGSFIFANVAFGEYLLVELESLPGYILLKDAIPVEVDADEVLLSDIINERGKISITKVDAVTGNILTGAKLQILDKDGNVVESWTSEDSAHVIDLLPVGEYVLHEEEAPVGYSKAEDIPFTIKEDTTAVELVMKDQPTGTTTTVPNTGDFGWVFALVVLGVSLIGAGLAVFFGRKK